MKIVLFMDNESYNDKAEKVVKYDDRKKEVTFYKVTTSYKKHDSISPISNEQGIKLALVHILNALQMNERVSEQMKIRLYTNEQKEQYIIDNVTRSKTIALKYTSLKGEQ